MLPLLNVPFSNLETSRTCVCSVGLRGTAWGRVGPRGGVGGLIHGNPPRCQVVVRTGTDNEAAQWQVSHVTLQAHVAQ